MAADCIIIADIKAGFFAFLKQAALKANIKMRF